MSTTQPTKIRRRSSRPSAGCILLIIVVCLAVTAGTVALISLDREVTSAFGESAEGINPISRIYYSIRLFAGENSLLEPGISKGGESVFEIRQGESVGSVAYRLETAGLVSDSDLFRIFLIYSGMDRSLQAGKYKIDPAKSPLEIARQLQNSSPSEVLFIILPGWRMEEVAASLPTTGLSVTPDEFLLAAGADRLILFQVEGVPDGSSLEGFLFPGEYLLPRQATVDQILDSALNGFQNSVPADVLEGFQNQGLTVYEAVTLASIVQREAVVAEEQPLISSVFYNRLASGMKLDSDPTVQYAIGFNTTQQTWWTNPLSTADLQIDSLYNTYLYPGLPPGPIANPGLSAMRAVAFPASTPYYYFRAKCDGSGQHSFAVTFEDHLNNACD